MEKTALRAIVVGSYRGLVRLLVSRLEALIDVEVVGIGYSGRCGLLLAKELKPDVVVAQFDMPDMTGAALTRAIKSDGFQPIVVVVSVKEVPEYKIFAERAGADAYLPRTLLDQLNPLVMKLAGRLN